jgi:hypothetical protein
MRKCGVSSISPQLLMIGAQYAYNHLSRSHVIRSDLGQAKRVVCVLYRAELNVTML